MNIGHSIKHCRLLAGMRQYELSKKCKLTQGYISNIERGNQQPSPAALGKIAKALKIEPVILLLISANITDIDSKKQLLYKRLSPAINSLIDEVLIQTYGKAKL